MDLTNWLQQCRKFREELMEIIRETDPGKHQQRLHALLDELIEYERLLELMLQVEDNHE